MLARLSFPGAMYCMTTPYEDAQKERPQCSDNVGDTKEGLEGDAKKGLHLRYDGRTLALFDGEEIRDTWPAKSGEHTNLGTLSYQLLEGPIWPGNWLIDPDSRGDCAAAGLDCFLLTRCQENAAPPPLRCDLNELGKHKVYLQSATDVSSTSASASIVAEGSGWSSSLSKPVLLVVDYDSPIKKPGHKYNWVSNFYFPDKGNIMDNVRSMAREEMKKVQMDDWRFRNRRLEMLNSQYTRLDTNGNESVEAEEFVDGANLLSLSPADAQRLFDDLDIDQNGVLDQKTSSPETILRSYCWACTRNSGMPRLHDS